MLPQNKISMSTSHKAQNSDGNLLSKIAVSKKASEFESSHLVHLNKKPKYNYLKGESRINMRIAGSNSLWNQTNFKDKEIIGKIFHKYEEKAKSAQVHHLLTPEGFRNMVKSIALRQGRGISNKEQISYTHMSNLRNIQGVFPRSVFEGIKETIEAFLKVIRHL